MFSFRLSWCSPLPHLNLWTQFKTNPSIVVWKIGYGGGTEFCNITPIFVALLDKLVGITLKFILW